MQGFPVLNYIKQLTDSKIINCLVQLCNPKLKYMLKCLVGLVTEFYANSLEFNKSFLSEGSVQGLNSPTTFIQNKYGSTDIYNNKKGPFTIHIFINSFHSRVYSTGFR